MTSYAKTVRVMVVLHVFGDAGFVSSAELSRLCCQETGELTISSLEPSAARHGELCVRAGHQVSVWRLHRCKHHMRVFIHRCPAKQSPICDDPYYKDSQQGASN